MSGEENMVGARARLFILGGDLVCDGLAEARVPLTEEAVEQMRGWVADYRAAVERDDPALLLSIGRELLGWLDGDEWASRWLRGAGERVLEIAVDSDDAEVARLLLDLPWELLADNQDFLAADLTQPFVVFRGIGRDRDGDPAEPAHRDLAVMFMAASPAGEQSLAYEAEETAILEATERLRVQVGVEESGCADFLKDRLAQEGPFEVVHVSCHGGIHDDQPVLALETPEGDLALQTPGEFAGALGEDKPSLVFVSACRTAESGAEFTEPFVRALVRSGVHNVLGWDGSVYDTDATRFAETFYGELAQHASVPFAASVARRNVLHAHRVDPRTGHHWHLARVYTGPGGAGSCCARGKPKRQMRRDPGYKEFLDKARNRVPVATAREFVGRRRQAQDVLRAFRDGHPVGVVLLGMGNLGKSSLAARVANRMPRHRTVVVYEHYDALAIFDQLVAALPAGQRVECDQSWRQQVANNSAVLGDVLADLLEGPFDEQPILMVVDDLEQILEPPRPGEVKTPVADGPGSVDTWRSALGSILRAFAAAETESRLLLTSRFDFTLPDGKGGDLAADLDRVHLPPTDESERLRQWRAAQHVAGHAESEESAEERALVDRAQALAGGNPGLQALLCRPILSGQLAVAREVMEVIATWKASGEEPEDENAAQEFFRRLTFETYRDALTDEELAQLRASTLFAEGLPIPVVALEAVGRALGVGDPGACLRRLLGLGLLDDWGAIGHGGSHASVNALARPLRGRDLTDAEQMSLAVDAIGPMTQAWEDEDGDLPFDERGVEVARLAFIADADLDVLDRAALAGGSFLFRIRHDARAALQVLQAALVRIEERRSAPSGDLLLLAAHCAERVGEGELRIALLEKGLTLEACDPLTQAQLSAQHAVATIAREGPDKALATLKEAATLFAGAGDEHSWGVAMGQIAEVLEQCGEVDEALRIRREEQLPVYKRLGAVREYSVVMGEIADILERRGEVDEALRIRREELPVYERLGDIRSAAVTMGKIADALERRGEVDEALRIRREEQLPVYKRLGDVRSVAVAMGRIADALERRGEVDEALRIRREEELPVYERLGDVGSAAVAVGRIADVLQRRGELDEALRIRREEQLPVYKRLGDVRSVAITMGRIADVLEQRGEVDEALRIRREEELPVYKRLGDIQSFTVTMGEVADVLQQRGELDEALRIRREEELPVYKRLGDIRSAAVTMGKIADVLQQRGEYDEALRIHIEERLPVAVSVRDMDSIAHIRFCCAILRIERGEWQRDKGGVVLDELIESFTLYQRLQQVDGIAAAGSVLGQVLMAAGASDEAASVFAESAAALERLARKDLAMKVRQLIDQGPSDD
jgi:tetratricopeptide (TPR) repeat protein